MNYAETIEFLFNQFPAYHRIGKAAYKNNLDNTLMLDEHFGHPHMKYRSIHVAGTNGKGSVSHMTASILQEAGYKTGLYTSPHLKDFRERIRIDGLMIPESDVVKFVEKNMEVIGSVSPSFFEMTVAMAFDYFAREKIDIAVVEVGLGGRLDSTNIITPLVSLITNIGHDHMDLLGDTLEKVAAEKAGIIKNGIPVVIGETQEDLKHVFVSSAAKAGSEIFFAEDDYVCTLEEMDFTSGIRHFTVREKHEDSLFKGRTFLGGDYQAKNIVSVFEIFRRIGNKLDISVDNILSGIERVIENTGLAGRWQIIGHDPLTICDTGHNREGLEYVVRQLEMTPGSRLHMVIGFVNDKDLNQVLPLLPKDAVYYFTRASVDRALNENVLREKAAEYGLNGISFPGVREAISAANSQARATDVIFIGGSTFIVADI